METATRPTGMTPQSASDSDRARLALEGSDLGVWDWHLGDDIVGWDARCREMLGLPNDNATTLGEAMAIVHPDDRAALEAAMACAVDPAVLSPMAGEFRVLRPDGTTRWIASRGRAVTETIGGELRVIRLVGTVRDITTERAGHDAQEEQAERLRAALHASRTGTFRWNIVDNSLDWDENLDRLFGLPAGNTVRSLQGFVDIVHPDDRQRVLDACARCAANGEGFDEEFRVIWPDGTEHWLDDKGMTYLDASGRPSYMTGACVEITDRKRSEQDRERLLSALSASDARLRRILESGIVGAFFWHIDGAITSANDAFLDLMGYTREELERGTIDWRKLTPDDWREKDVAAVHQLMTEGRHGNYEKEYYAADGTRMPVLIASAFFEGSREEGVALCIDLRDRREIERALAAREEELECALAIAEDARREAELANASKSAFLATMSHELRTPLNAIGGYVDLIEMGIRGPVTDEQRQDLGRVRRSQTHLLALINDVLNFARLDAGATTFERTAVSLAETIAAAEAMVSPQLAAKSLRFSARVDGDVVALADGDKLRQVLINLIGNAVKFTDRGGSIAVTASNVAEMVHVTVTDSGIGVPSDKLERIFEPFVQVDRDYTRPHEGVGLGLAISRELARGMGGDLVAASTEGQGSSFTLSLPTASSS